MTEQRTLTIDLEEVTEIYEQGLLDRLRGFGAEESIFETWVPDANTEKSIFNLIDAAVEANFDGVLVLHIPEKMASEVTLRRFSRTLEFPSNLTAEVEKGWRLQVSGFDKTGILEPNTAGSKKIQVQQSTGKTIHSSPIETPDHENGGGTKVSRCRFYDLPLSSYRNYGVLEEEVGLINSTSVLGEWRFTLQLEPETHLVKKAAFSGPKEDSTAPLLDELCEQIVGRPIVDVSDHSVSRLEFAVRQNRPPPVPGISLPLAVDERFHVLQALIRESVETYRQKSGYQVIDNSFFDEPAESWVTLSASEQASKISDTLKNEVRTLGFSGDDIEVVDVEFNVRVLVRFSGKMAALETDKQALVMKFERLLINEVDSRLELFLELVKDQSVLRRLGGKEEA